MVKARMHVTLSEGQWKADVSRGCVDCSVRLLGMVSQAGRAVETVSVSGENLETHLVEIETHPAVDRFEVMERSDESAVVHVETPEPEFLSIVSRVGTPPRYPVDVTDGELQVTVSGTHAAISSLGDALQAEEVSFELQSVQPHEEVHRILTRRQEEVFVTAVEQGYYRSPRRCSLTEVAEEVDIAKSTCCSILQRCEEAVVDYFCRQQQLSNSDSVEPESVSVSGRSSS